ncbi:gp53-like domain-containing protein [Sphingobium abikonense]|uniref:gp53-like domain-containing protein n=1 Tax=Sphingobium abikonense TaxID=86193 RepID=UPI003516D2B1
MDPILFMITAAGLDALVDAQGGGTDPIQIAAVGLTANAFTMAPTITALPGEIKRLDTVSGAVVSETVIHMTAQDVSTDIYELRGLGLYLADGTLFAVYSQATPLFRKVSIAFFLLALDIAFSNGVAGDIVFGDNTFLMPPATETVKGVAEIATAAEAAAGADDERIITPAKLRQVLDALGELIAPDSDNFADAFAALIARTITGSGLVSGGGDLSDSRVLTVTAASAAEVAAGVAANKAITPAALSGLARSLAQNGYAYLPGTGGLLLQWGRFSAPPNTTTNTLFPIAFPSACFAVTPCGGVAGGADSQDNPPVLVTSGITSSGFAVFSADDNTSGMAYLAIGI